MQSSNDGISVTGHGELKVHGPVAVGRNARAEAVYAPPPSLELGELRVEIDRLVEVLVNRRDEITNAESVIADAEQASREAREPSPDKRSLVELLGRVAAGVASITGLAQAVEALRQVVGRLLP